MQQTLDRFCLVYGEKEMEMKAKVRIRVLSIQWLNRHIDELEGAGCTPGLIVVDEAHHAIADSYQDLFDRNRKALKLGMTATPCRMNKKSFGKTVRDVAEISLYQRLHPAWLSGTLRLCGNRQVLQRPV